MDLPHHNRHDADVHTDIPYYFAHQYLPPILAPYHVHHIFASFVISFIRFSLFCYWGIACFVPDTKESYQNIALRLPSAWITRHVYSYCMILFVVAKFLSQLVLTLWHCIMNIRDAYSRFTGITISNVFLHSFLVVLLLRAAWFRPWYEGKLSEHSVTFAFCMNHT